MTVLRTLTATLILLATSLCAAEARDSGWTLRFHGSYVHSSASHEQLLPGSRLFTGEANSGFGLDLGAEVRLSKIVGLEPSVSVAWLDADFTLQDGGVVYTDSDVLRMTTIGLAVDLHLTGDRAVDVWIAPSLNFVVFGDMYAEFPGLGRLPLTTGSDLAPGLGVGIDVPLGERGWAFSAGLRFMKAESEETDNPPGISPIRVDVDPWFLQVGFAYRF